MSIWKAAWLTGLLALAPVAALAKRANACATPNSTIEINACAQQKFAAADQRLNAAYRAVLKQLDTYRENGPGTKKALIDAQRKWVAFRDADCKARAALYQGGSIAPSVYLECMIGHADARTRVLQPDTWTAG